MKRISVLGALAIAIAFGAACEDITNPIEETGQIVDPYVHFVSSSADAPPGATVLVIFQLPTKVEEDIDIEFTFSGDAVLGTDFQAVDRDGNARDDVSAAGGDAHITFVADETLFGRDTLFISVHL